MVTPPNRHDFLARIIGHSGDDIAAKIGLRRRRYPNGDIFGRANDAFNLAKADGAEYRASGQTGNERNLLTCSSFDGFNKGAVIGNICIGNRVL